MYSHQQQYFINVIACLRPQDDFRTIGDDANADKANDCVISDRVQHRGFWHSYGTARQAAPSGGVRVPGMAGVVATIQFMRLVGFLFIFNCYSVFTKSGDG